MTGRNGRAFYNEISLAAYISPGHVWRLTELMKNWNNDPPLTSYNADNVAIRRYRRYFRYCGSCHTQNPHPHVLRAAVDLTPLTLNT